MLQPPAEIDHVTPDQLLDDATSTFLGELLTLSLRENKQLAVYIVAGLARVQSEHHFEQPRWSSEHLAELHTLDRYYSDFVDYTIALHERLGMSDVYSRYFIPPVYDGNTLRTCTDTEREELYRLRAHLLTKWRTLLPTWLRRDLQGWCLSKYHLLHLVGPGLVFIGTSRCVHGLMSYGQCMAGELGVGELLEVKEGRRDVLRDDHTVLLWRGHEDYAKPWLWVGGLEDFPMQARGLKGADDSTICSACERGYVFTTKPLDLWPDQLRWMRVRPKGSRKILSDRWGLATAIHNISLDEAASCFDKKTKEVCVATGEPAKKRLWIEKQPTPKLLLTRALLLRPESIAALNSIADREQLAESFFGLREAVTKEEYLSLNMPPRNAKHSFVPAELRMSRLNGPISYGDYRALPSEPKFLTQRNSATRYVKTGGLGSRCSADLRVLDVGLCPLVEQKRVERQAAKDCEQVRLSYRTEFVRGKLIRRRRLHYLGLNFVADLRLRATRAVMWAESISQDTNDSELLSQVRKGLVHQSELLNGGRRVSTSSYISSRLEREDWSIGVRRSWQGEFSWDHGAKDTSSRDRRQRLTRKLWKLENRHKSVAHCANCGIRFAGRKGQACCGFDCAAERRKAV